ncbi:hypothetical protein RhiirA1_453727 [Rhizophagus irregularis]|uniref:Uncharacterized protein n=1 Tax=Rhizophagus irregularis TaxID=588596 RepID=A0A2I1DZ59_9GLOM|nr:hypothetical protein RhiirA1_453727 [Rhizophagus irregularis]PKY15153.1 hypothetical protein RhiirB3_427301 [Rhizophagus irregularis]
MVQLIETSREKITEIIQAEFNRKGSQLKTRIVVYCTRTVEGEISITYIDKYHDGEIQVLPIKSFNGYFLLEFYKYEWEIGGSYIATPESFANKKATINLTIELREMIYLCLQYALAEYFLHLENNGVVKNLQNLNKFRPYLYRVNLKGIPMSTFICLRVFEKIKKQNPKININVWEWAIPNTWSWCYGMDNTPQKVTLPKANGFPYVIKVDFESKQKKTDGIYAKNCWTKMSFPYTIHWIDTGEIWGSCIYRGPNATEEFVKRMDIEVNKIFANPIMANKN